ncbi:branched-chain amino acid ABC transporter permease [Chrysiogenes arsenatis]|uniref:branched-chain amino acid ABC transporter permease n=1 Tax=Chrysiogenes arsenatis TaxID=309797 RepID=UPI000409768F|nr:branched-chain amino acid ABC transporter permease [Chrysiogenes arsenatis]
MSDFLQILVSGSINGMTYAVIAIGFVIIYNATQIINFAQGEYVMLGALSAIWLISGWQIPILLAFILATAFVVVVSYAMERVTIRPQISREPINLILITIACSILLKGAAMFLWGKDPLPMQEFTPGAPIMLGGIAISRQGLWIVASGFLAMFLLHLFFSRTLLGKGMIACSIDRRTASLMGIDTKRATNMAFLLAGAIGALAGIVLAPVTMMSYLSGTILGLKGFCAAILGGLNSISGVVLGGIIIGVLEALTAGYFSSGYKDAVAFIVMLLVLFFRPEGLFGKKGIKRV